MVIRIRPHTKKLLLALPVSAALLLLFLLLRGFFGAQLERQAADARISFSHPSGFYPEAFELEILGSGRYDIHYTLDGSDPTPESPVYRHGTPLLIDDASPDANQYASRPDVSVGYDQALLEEYCGQSAAYTVTDEPVDKCTILRAAAFHRGKRVGEIVHGVYFVFPEQFSDYQKLYTVSVTADPDDLFGYERGIMVTGRTLDDYFASQILGGAEHKSTWYSSYWWWWPANYRNTGAAWERRAHISVFNEEQALEMDQDCGIRVQGGGSRGRALRSLRCFSRPKYSGADRFDVSWFGDGIQPDSFLLFSGGDDYGFNLRDLLIQELCQELNIATMDFIPCALFLNGEFWGLYHITEDYNAGYLADHYQVDENSLMLIKNGEVEAGEPPHRNIYLSMQDAVSGDLSEPEKYLKVCELIDVDSFIDYYALQIYIARYNDWPGSNFALWRTEERGTSPFGDGRWRWMLFDLNSGALAGPTYNRAGEDSIQYVLENDRMFAALFTNAEFRAKFAERLLYIGDELLDAERCAAFMDSFDADTRTLLYQTNMRIYNEPRQDVIDAYYENLKLFFVQRRASIEEQLSAHLAGR